MPVVAAVVAITDFDGEDRGGLDHEGELVDAVEQRVLAMPVQALTFDGGQVGDPAGAGEEAGDFPVHGGIIQGLVGIDAVPALNESLARVNRKPELDLLPALVRVFKGRRHGRVYRALHFRWTERNGDRLGKSSWAGPGRIPF